MGTSFFNTNTRFISALAMALLAASGCSRHLTQSAGTAPQVEAAKVQPKGGDSGGNHSPEAPQSSGGGQASGNGPDHSVLSDAAIPVQAASLRAGLAQITILGTNDFHGGIEPTDTASGGKIGGLAFYAGVVRSIRQGVKTKLGDDNGGVLVVDAGDQFQGTLLSNFDEGKLMMSAMSIIGYDVAIPGKP